MSEQIIDLPELLERVQNDKELLLELFDIFIEDFGHKREALEIALNKKDLEEIKMIAHSLKGASGNISAKPLRAVCLKLEDSAKRNSFAEIHPLLGELDEQFEKLVVHIGHLRKELQK